MKDFPNKYKLWNLWRDEVFDVFQESSRTQQLIYKSWISTKFWQKSRELGAVVGKVRRKIGRIYRTLLAYERIKVRRAMQSTLLEVFGTIKHLKFGSK